MRSVKLFGPKRDKDRCEKHQKMFCAVCCHCVVDHPRGHSGASIDVSVKIDRPPRVEVGPLFGTEAGFDMHNDHQLKIKWGATFGGELDEPSELARETRGPPCEVSAGRNHFRYCSRCGVSYLIGTAGQHDAEQHPAHLATSHANNIERSIVVYVNCRMVRQDEPGRCEGQYSVFWGYGSKFNEQQVYWDFDDEREAKAQLEFHACRRALFMAAPDIMARRERKVNKVAYTNSEKFLWDLTKFRLLVVTPTDVPDAIQKIGATLFWDADKGCYYDKISKEEFSTSWSWSLKKLEKEIKLLATKGIEVKWSHVGQPGEAYRPEWGPLKN
jgi:hypothetical protein